MSKRLIAAAAAAAVAATGLLVAPASAGTTNVRLLGEKIIPKGLVFAGTAVGGLSGIDRDPRTGEYVLISDDRSAINPARFYTAKIDVSKNGIGDVTFTSTHPFLQPDGTTYPNGGVDPEDIRADPWTGQITWSQEGERKPGVLIDPSIRNATRDGKFRNELPLPANEHMSAGETGPRQNLVLEGLSYAAAGTLVVSSVESPLLQDGPLPTQEKGALSRVTVQARTGQVLAQYAYPQEPIFAFPNPPTASASTGVSAMVAADPLDPTRFLLVERSFVTGVGNRVRIFEASTLGATNVLDKSLTGAKPMHKRLLADLADLKLSTVDNVEGITWGPRLPSGERTLLLVSDDNFSPTQVTQIVALAVRYPQ
ncbi:esterase-like activity of phytase family protein [Actinocrispum sp. NPDC049592]|uniref:esterase-like activity of phytase family protein n=1 Tax=Actinocrispum sp. NPDC049592 TaxID=3154835 RepID=UPI00344151C4